MEQHKEHNICIQRFSRGALPGAPKQPCLSSDAVIQSCMFTTSGPTLFEVLSADEEEGVPRPDILDACLVLRLDPVLAPAPLRSVGPLDGHDRAHRVLLATLFEEIWLLRLAAMMRLPASLLFINLVSSKWVYVRRSDSIDYGNKQLLASSSRACIFVAAKAASLLRALQASTGRLYPPRSGQSVTSPFPSTTTSRPLPIIAASSSSSSTSESA